MLSQVESVFQIPLLFAINKVIQLAKSTFCAIVL